MVFPRGPMSAERKAAIAAGHAARNARLESGEPVPVKRRRAPHSRQVRAEPPSTKGGTPIATVDGAARDALALVLDELRAIRVLLDTRLPGWTAQPGSLAYAIGQADKAATAPQQTGAIAQQCRDNQAVVCQTCRDDGWILHVYARGPGDAPGNALVGCPDCPKGRELAAAQSAERVPMPASFVYNQSPSPERSIAGDARRASDALAVANRERDRLAAADLVETADAADEPTDPMADLAAELEEYASLDELPPPPPDEESVWRPRVEMFRNFGMWIAAEWGAPPGKRGCGAPDWLLDEVGIAKVVG